MQLRKESLKKSGLPGFARIFCEDLLYIYFFIPQFKYMSFIYSQFHNNNCLAYRPRMDAARQGRAESIII